MDGQRRQWPVLAAAGLLFAGVAAGAPTEQTTSDTQAVPSVRTPAEQRTERGGGVRPPEVVTAASRVTPDGRIIVWPSPVAGVIPGAVYVAYQRAVAAVGEAQPGCHLPLSLLAAIGKVESGHARGGRLDATGTTVSPILGPTLDGGPGLAAIADTDGGAFDDDIRWDRAVGPMQFIPGTWRRWATDGNDDGDANPHNMFDAAGAAGRYLCANGRDLATDDGLDAAILSYNNSPSYLRIVRTWMVAYEQGATTPVDWTPPTDQPDSAPTAPATPTAPAPAPARPDDGVEPPPVAAPAPPPPAEPEQPAPTPQPTNPVTGLVCTVDGVVDGVGGLLTGIGGLLTGTAPAEPAPAGEDC